MGDRQIRPFLVALLDLVGVHDISRLCGSGPVYLQFLPKQRHGMSLKQFRIFTNVHEFPISHRVRMPLVWDLVTGRRCHRRTAVFGHLIRYLEIF